MATIIENDRVLINYLERKLTESGYHFPSNPTNGSYELYRNQVRSFLLSQGHETEYKINEFFAEVEQLHIETMPSENELSWYSNNPMASLWLSCKLYNKLIHLDKADYINYLSPESLQPVHSVRVDAIRRCIDNWPIYLFSPATVIREESIKWARLVECNNLFRDVHSKSIDVSLWLKNYIQENIRFPLNYLCGESSEETMAWCYTNYFVWVENNQSNPDSIELFNRKFKSAWSTQKNRIKNRVEKKLKPLNINISTRTHTMLREMSIERGMSSDNIIESAIALMYKSHGNKSH
ncbi:hypothetical protein DCF83_16025 [Edwardsiella tarda]|uniref:hypothetical protein n=1 Tax=Edwardsiella tarda TaxID=636 RepID=UPI000D51976A|nr:hypothetical protein [Edwardsiella tarda]UCQ27486.1 hypothetical protein DCF83_16025 [Edwardsiella tarda]